MIWIAPSEKQTAPARIECRLVDEIVWLSKARLEELFDRSKKTVSEHLQNLFEDGELGEDSVVKESLTTAADGKLNITLGTLKTMLVSVPTIDVQEEITQTLALLDTKSSCIWAKQSALQDLFCTLLMN